MAAPGRKLSPLPLTQVTVGGPFWGPWVEANRRASLPHVYEACKNTGRIDALRLQWRPGDPNPPHIFWDSDVAKWLEAAAYELAVHPDAALAQRAEETADLLIKAQQPDGYLNTHFTVVEPEKRWTNLRDWHELYCAGHLIEAAVAYFEATGRRNLLDALCRYADHIDATFGPEEGKKRGYPGHEELELALVRLYRATGEARYLRLAEYFINERGRQPHYYDLEAQARGDTRRWMPYEYWQVHKPVREQEEAVGHAVRAMYLCSGMADVAAETGDATLLAACRRLWRSVTERKMYVTGAVGARHHGEAFGDDWELPNDTAYAETCAAIGLVFFAQRMLELEADGRYADVLERALYNGVLPGVSLDGRKFFYVNPLASGGRHRRQPFFDCACCPPNVARLLASLGRYACGTEGDKAIYVHLYATGEAIAALGGRRVSLTQATGYPWDGTVDLAVGLDGPARFELALRVPGWCRKHALRVNGKAVAAPVRKGYARLRRTWNDGDRVTLILAMPVERVEANPVVDATAGKVALQRGPLVYCLEGCDHRVDVRTIRLPDRARLAARFDKRLLGGVTVIEGKAVAPAAGPWKDRLYASGPAKTVPVAIRAVPYCLWDNRKGGTMAVWLPRA